MARTTKRTSRFVFRTFNGICRMGEEEWCQLCDSVGADPEEHAEERWVREAVERQNVRRT